MVIGPVHGADGLDQGEVFDGQVDDAFTDVDGILAHDLGQKTHDLPGINGSAVHAEIVGAQMDVGLAFAGEPIAGDLRRLVIDQINADGVLEQRMSGYGFLLS